MAHFFRDPQRLWPLAYGFGIMLAFWLILYWMYRRKLFLRI
jgi:predicted acyltransferase